MICRRARGSPRARRQRVRLFGTWSGLAIDLASKVPTEHPDAREPSHPGNDDPMTVPAAFAGESVDSMVVTGTYNPYLVALSILVASVASYTALDLGGHAELGYEPLFVALSVVIAIGASTAALWLAVQTTDPWQKLVAALVMGVAISGMHYTGMRAAIFTAHGSVHEAPVNASLDQTNLALAVAGITFVILTFASIASLSEQKRAEEALRESEERWRA